MLSRGGVSDAYPDHKLGDKDKVAAFLRPAALSLCRSVAAPAAPLERRYTPPTSALHM